MKINDDIAEFLGVFIGDGCLSRWTNYDRLKEAIVITGNRNNDKDYYLTLQDILEKNFSYNGRLYFRKDQNTVLLWIYNKSIINLLLSLGFKFGKKAESVKIPKVILDNKKFAFSCIRGIFNTDGCVYRRYKGQSYAVVQIKMKSLELLKEIKYVLENEGFTTNKIIKDTGKYGITHVLRITNQGDIDRFFREIATSHPYHKNRYLNIKSK